MGLQRVSAEAVAPPRLQAFAVKLSSWPNTESAVVSPLPATTVAVRGVLYSSSRLLSKSATYRLLLLSSVTPTGWQRLAALNPPKLQLLSIKSLPLPLPCPNSRFAVVLAGGLLLSWYSAPGGLHNSLYKSCRRYRRR